MTTSPMPTLKKFAGSPARAFPALFRRRGVSLRVSGVNNDPRHLHRLYRDRTIDEVTEDEP
jgi:hypothetical protein